VEKVAETFGLLHFIFMYITAQSSPSPNRRKIAQSVHPGT
jgi:hypothetical protein